MFITLYDYNDGTPFKVNVAHLVMYSDYAIYTSTKSYFHVQETAAEIDKLLGLWEE